MEGKEKTKENKKQPNFVLNSSEKQSECNSFLDGSVPAQVTINKLSLLALLTMLRNNFLWGSIYVPALSCFDSGKSIQFFYTSKPPWILLCNDLLKKIQHTLATALPHIIMKALFLFQNHPT